MECRRTNPQSSLPTFPSHTPTYTNAGPDGLLVHLGTLCVHRPSQGYTHNPPGLPVRLQGCTCTGISMPSHGRTLRQTPNQDVPGPQPFPPILGSMFLHYLSYKRQHGSACVLARCGVQSSWILSPCGLPVSCCLATSVVRSCSPGCPSALGGARVVFPHPGSLWFWEAWKRHSYGLPPRDLGVRGVSVVWMWTLVFGWPELAHKSPVRLPSCSRFILGSGVELN